MLADSTRNKLDILNSISISVALYKFVDDPAVLVGKRTKSSRDDSNGEVFYG